MRTDNNLGQEYLTSKDWNDDKPDQHLQYNVFETIEENGQKRIVMNSLSGWERNHLFLNRGGVFEDISAISGTDTDRDSRAHCTLDFDRNGYSDLAVANANKPQLQVFRNRIGELCQEQRNFIALKLVGGNSTSMPSTEFSCRDAVGTLVELATGDLTYVRELRFGEGFAGQNSCTMILGLNQNDSGDVAIRWLSGKSQEIKAIPSGSLLTVFENKDESSDGSGFDVEPYLRNVDKPQAQLAFEGVLDLQSELPGNDFQLVVSMATWCTSCKKQSPQIKLLKDHFADKLGLVGLPMDPQDSRQDLIDYVAKNKPGYEMQYEVSELVREEFKGLVASSRGKTSLPSSVLIDSKGNVIESWLGIPSISDVANIIDKRDNE